MKHPSSIETREPAQNVRLTDISSPWRAAIIFAASVFIAELAIMLTLFIVPPLPPLIEALVDSAGLVILIFPVILSFLIKPLTIALSERDRTLEENLALNLTLSERVAERTQELEVVNASNLRRAIQFETLAMIARTISSAQQMDTLLPLITQVTSEQFGLYHVGIYLKDARDEFLELVAANGETGMRMVAERHRLKIGQAGLVGYVAATGQPRHVTNTGPEAAFFNNPFLPEAQSEVGISLQIREKIIGVLDVQSTNIDAFSQEDIYVLSALADQITIAIENARLLEQTRQALAQSEAVHQRYVEQSWQQFAIRKRLTGFDFDGKESRALNQIEVQNAAEQAREQDNALAIPLVVGGQSIGTLSVRPQNRNRQLSQEERDLLTGVAERTALALENARLLEESQKRAAKEQTISQAAARIGASLDFGQILAATAKELEQALGSSEIIINLENRE